MSAPSVPYAFAAERATLGAIFRDPRAIEGVAEWLKPDMFGLESHAWVYEAMLAAQAQRTPPDRLVVAQLLETRDAVLELPLPVVPIGLGNVLPEAPSGRVKFLERMETVTRWRLVVGRSWGSGVAVHRLQAHYRGQPGAVKLTTGSDANTRPRLMARHRGDMG